MNRIYRSIWNDKTGTFVAASASAKSDGKKSSPGATAVAGAVAGNTRFVRKGLALSLSLMLAFGSNVYAGPTGGAVSAGSASIAGGAGKTTISQSSQNVAINWQGFNIGQTEAVRFVQPNSSSVALNRVLGSDPSSILGSLSANGKVFLVNPNGILFGKGAQVNVGGLVASTLNITDGDFMAGRYNFAGAGNGTILNQGSINADGGYVALLGANVSNQGVISAKLGTVALAAGNAVTLDMAGDGLLNVSVNQGAVNALVQNGGVIRADGGQVLLTAQSAGNLLQSAVNNTGVIQAQTIENHKGTIRLLGDMQSGTVNLGGTLDASGTGAGQNGGSVTATGQHVGLFGGHINASGDAGGGTVLIGGDLHGATSAVQNASATYMSADSTISADAITNGSGGTVVLWSNDSTRAYGSITARGGAQGGDGGLIETSGHWLDVAGISVNASAPNGKRGTWLLDPADVTITAGTTGGSFDGANPNVFSPASGVNAATVDAAALQNALGVGGAGTDVTITTRNIGAPGVPPSGLGNITVASTISWSPTTPTTLTLNTAGDVNISAAVTTTRGNLVVCCGQDVNVNAAITTTNGSVLLAAGRDVNVLRTLLNNATAITMTDGNMALCAGRNINLSNTFNPGLAPLMTLTRGSVTAGEDLSTLGVARGLTLSAGTAATGPGPAGGTVVFTNGGLAGTYITTTGPAPVTPTNIFYNPISYSTTTDYSTFFTGNGSPLTQYMLVYPVVTDKTLPAGDTSATFSGFFKPDLTSGTVPGAVTLVAGPSATANFADLISGSGKTVTFSGYSLTQAPIVPGGTGVNFALPVSCCAPKVGITTGNIIAAGPTTSTTAGPTTSTTAGPTTSTTVGPTTSTTVSTTTTTTVPLAVVPLIVPPVTLPVQPGLHLVVIGTGVLAPSI